MDSVQQEYLKRAREMEKKRLPFEDRGGWPTPHGQPWDSQEQYRRNAPAKPWMTFVEKEMAEIRAACPKEDEDVPIWW